MAPITSYRAVECRTIDGIRLEAWFWQVKGSAPAIIMTHGLNCIKEMSLQQTAEAFQAAGYNVLLYDSRSVGGSGGLPRNQIDPWQITQDLSALLRHPSVDPKRILLWGISLGASISGCAAAIDRRVVAVLMVCPIFAFIRPDKRATAFAQLIRDRKSQLRGNEPFTLPPFNDKGENPAGYAGSGGPGGLEAHLLMRTATERGHPNFRDRITLQTFHKLALFRPGDLLDEMLELPTMMIIPERDALSLPKDQLAAFEKIKAPKRLHWAKDAGHMDVLTGEGSADVLAVMLQFFRSALQGDIR
ncbi:alpha/beta-hydrolase [Trichoderma citrinoviride]|uniref:Alpha/beta-hydrolase n=1 Tax=Trichoderma citrinoviride TaxID=58853 RepID=A0A2T4BBU4_9HYPO|nr:alpha/beta-hydrolase [Trichoderma citrinoviride]PTB66758.1 alpha/beta-hydrolase [Trichoderma citrinoviride]